MTDRSAPQRQFVRRQFATVVAALEAPAVSGYAVIAATAASNEPADDTDVPMDVA